MQHVNVYNVCICDELNSYDDDDNDNDMCNSNYLQFSSIQSSHTYVILISNLISNTYST
jgi:adenosine/AMP kinase